jgi:energy-converting hydrogenase Eha subunit G
MADWLALTIRPLLASGLTLAGAARIALAADTDSITVMEIVDNAVMLVVPGAMGATLANPLFWGMLVVSLALAAVAAFPVNRWLIARGRGHAVVHPLHH